MARKLKITEMQGQSLSHGLFIFGMNLMELPAVDGHRYTRVSKHPKGPHLTFPDNAPVLGVRVMLISVHGKLHHEERQSVITPILSPLPDQPGEQRIIILGPVIVALPLIIYKTSQCVRRHPFQHSLIEP